MFLRHTTANENDVGAWERGHLGTDSIFRGEKEDGTLSGNGRRWVYRLAYRG